MKKSLLTLALLSMTTLAFAKTLVTVDGTKIDSKQVDEQVALLKKQSNNQIQDTPQLRDNITAQMIVHTVVVKEAKRLKLDKSKEYLDIIKEVETAAANSGDNKKAGFAQDFALFKENLLAEAYAVHITKTKPVTDAEVKEAYKQMTDFYKGSREVQLAEIVTKTQADADKALAELKAKKKFADVAKKYTIDEEAKKNGGKHSGYINLNDMKEGAPPLHQAISVLKKGEYSNILQAPGIYTIFSVVDSRPAKMPALSEVKNMLTAQIQGIHVNEAVDALVQKADIKEQ